MDPLVILKWAAILGLIPAVIAWRKGHPFILWWLYGTFMLVMALPHALLARDATRKACPECAETVRIDAKLCRHCGHRFG